MVIEFSELITQAELLFNDCRVDEADTICRYLLLKDPANLEVLFLSGNIAFASSRVQDACEHFRRASILDPDNPVILNNYGLSLLETARNSNNSMELLLISVRILERAVALSTEYVPALISLGRAHKELKNYAEALRCFGNALHSAPDNPVIWMQIGELHSAFYHHFKAIDCYSHLLHLAPQDKAVHLNRIAIEYTNIGEASTAVDYYRQAIAAAPIQGQKRQYASSRLFYLHYLPDISPEEIAVEHLDWGRSYFITSEFPAFLNTPETDRKLRIGYVSGDFRINAVLFFIQPVLAAHDPAAFEVYCYSNTKEKDVVTDQLIHKHRIIWREIRGIADDAAWSMIRTDRIDILVDLSGHCAENRLPLFALRPAPVQATWIGYPDTTGLPAIDYRITDAKTDPPGTTEHLHTEELVRLPRSFLCYNPGADFPEEGPPPCEQNGYITFGAMSNFTKVNDPLLDVWCRIMTVVPGSRLVLRYRGQERDQIHNKLAARLELNGISPARLQLLGRADSIVEQLNGYRLIDVALDTFPYHGTTTTCEALYMGVPVISLEGRSHHSRVGVSLLETVGLSEFVANNREEYIGKAVAISSDLPLLKALRRNLRSMILASPLCDNRTFTADLEELYRDLWIRWCNKADASCQ